MNKVNAPYLFNLAERYSFFRAGISAFGNTYRAMAPTINLTVGTFKAFISKPFVPDDLERSKKAAQRMVDATQDL